MFPKAWVAGEPWWRRFLRRLRPRKPLVWKTTDGRIMARGFSREITLLDENESKTLTELIEDVIRARAQELERQETPRKEGG